MKIFVGILLLIASFLLLFLSFMIVDFVFFEGTKLKDIQYKDECNFEIPEGYKIVSNGKYYAVEKNGLFGKEYLCDRRGGITLYPSLICAPTVLSSECKAKAYLKDYIYQNRDRAKDFK